MSITSKISAAIIGTTAFGLFATAAINLAGDARPTPASVVADGHWGQPPTPVPTPNPGAPLTITDDGHWG